MTDKWKVRYKMFTDGAGTFSTPVRTVQEALPGEGTSACTDGAGPLSRSTPVRTVQDLSIPPTVQKTSSL